MIHIRRIQSEDILKVLGNPTRLEVLRLLMKQPATISQLGESLGKHAAQIRNHIKQMEEANLVELISVRTVKNYTEKYYQATARAYFINMAILPASADREYFVALGSDDMALNSLASYLHNKNDTPELYLLPVGSMDGLIYLREKYCQLSGCHLLDLNSGEYNLSYVRSLFLEQPMVLVTLAHRHQGLLVQKGNPSDIHGITDLVRSDIKYVNRKRGSGTRLLLDQQLQRYGIKSDAVRGYENEVRTHLEVAEAISSGTADTGLGIQAAARQMELDFIPLTRERFDLVLYEEMFNNPKMQRIIEHIQSAEFRQTVDLLGGYESAHSGDIIHIR